MFDITLKIDESMPVWPGDPRPVQAWLQRIDRGDPVDVSQWTLGSHTGTHVDAPSHFIAGAPDLEAVGLEPFVGPCRVIELERLDLSINPLSSEVRRQLDEAFGERWA